MKRRVRTVFVFVFLCFCATFLAQAESILPLAPDNTWQYEITNSEAKGEAASTMIVRAVAAEKSDAQGLVRLETLINDSLVKTEAVAAEERGLFCYERVSAAGKTTSFNPPRLLLPDPISVGTKWETDEMIAGNETHLKFSVAAEEDVVVPAGTFHAFRAQCDEAWPVSKTIARWFVPGVGLVKDVTSTRGPGGRLLDRVTTALTKFSRGSAATAGPGPSVMVPSITPPSSPVFKLEIAKDRDGPPAEEIKADARNVFVRWSGENLPVNAIVRLAWVAEDVGDLVEPNFIVDQTRTRVTTPSFGARFTLSRPKDGWASGKYRVDLYLDDELSASAAVTIRD
ncbi:MAG: hypothetical protein ACXV9Q_01370 [Chthoniobacterales bacterium]